MTTRRRFLQAAGLAFLGLALTPSALLAAAESTHVVRKGETLSSIAKRHGVSVAGLKARNKLSSDTIKVGQRLTIPATSRAVTRTAQSPVLAGVIEETRKLKIKRGHWKYIVLHHSGIERGNARSYHAAHLRRRMEHGLAYHFVIGNGRDSGEGQIEIGPRWIKQLHGGHVRREEYNQHGIGICLVGNFETRRPTSRQLASMTALVDWLRNEAPLGGKPSVTVHRWVDRNHTVCPGKFFPFEAVKQRYA